MIIALIPAYNEEAHIARVVSETKKYVDKVIVIDDGSRDATAERAKEAGATVLRHIINMGKGLALKTGFEAVSAADIMITLDGDGQHDPKEIPRFISAVQHADIVIGARQMNSNMPFVLRAGNVLLHKAFSFLFHASIHDTQSGFRAFRGGVYEHIVWQSCGYSVETEMLIKARKKGLRCIEIPIKTVYLNAVKGTTVIDGIKILMDMLLWKLKG